MKIAVMAVTRRGAVLADRTAEVLRSIPGTQVDLMLPTKFIHGHSGALPYRRPLAEMCGYLFKEYRCLVMVMALGIVFRLLAPHLNDKRKDPAVVVMDERGQFAISALSGHLGGANDLARYLQEHLGARAVITTATDVHGLPAIDLLARDFNLAVEPFEQVKAVNAAIVNGDPVFYYSDIPLKGNLASKFDLLPLEAYKPENKCNGFHVFITNKNIVRQPPGALFLRPRNIIAGLGCRKGIEADAVLTALEEALQYAGKSLSSVRLLTTVDIRAGEKGILLAAQELKLPVAAFTTEDIREVFHRRGDELTFSQYVFDRIGVGGVCEPTALLAAPESKLILKKRALNGVTVALAEEALPSLEPDRVNWGRLVVRP